MAVDFLRSILAFISVSESVDRFESAYSLDVLLADLELVKVVA